jgi:hypothetical protein
VIQWSNDNKNENTRIREYENIEKTGLDWIGLYYGSVLWVWLYYGSDESNSGRLSCEKSAEEKSDDIKKVLSANDQMTNMGNVSKDVTNAVGTMKYVGQCHDLTLLMFLPLAESAQDVGATKTLTTGEIMKKYQVEPELVSHQPVLGGEQPAALPRQVEQQGPGGRQLPPSGPATVLPRAGGDQHGLGPGRLRYTSRPHGGIQTPPGQECSTPRSEAACHAEHENITFLDNNLSSSGQV